MYCIFCAEWWDNIHLTRSQKLESRDITIKRWSSYQSDNVSNTHISNRKYLTLMHFIVLSLVIISRFELVENNNALSAFMSSFIMIGLLRAIVMIAGDSAQNHTLNECCSEINRFRLNSTEWFLANAFLLLLLKLSNWFSKCNDAIVVVFLRTIPFKRPTIWVVNFCIMCFSIEKWKLASPQGETVPF